MTWTHPRVGSCYGKSMTFDDAEETTRPDLPSTTARKCKHCGRVYGEHAKGSTTTLVARCRGLRSLYEPEAHAEAEHAR